MDNMDITDEKMGFTAEQMHIFICALRLFAEYGYEQVAVGTIAKNAGVKTSAIYYLGGKRGLLEACYKYFEVHRYDTRLTPEEYKPIIEKGTITDIINVLVYKFPDDIGQNMFECLTVILAHVYIDENARNIYTNDIDQSMKYMKDFFNYGIEIGRIKPFDIKAVSILAMGLRIFGLQLAIIRHGKFAENEEQSIFHEINKMIPFVY